MSKPVDPRPLHVRFIGKEESMPTKVQVYVHNNLAQEVEYITPGDMARLVADIYGMPITFDRVDEEPKDQLTVITADHLNEPILFDAVGYNGDIHIMHARFSLGRAVNAKLVEAAKRVGVPTDLLHDAVRFVDNPESMGNYRVYAVQRRMNPAYAQFLAVMHWVPDTITFNIDFSNIVVKEGEFGKGGQVDLDGIEI